MQLDRPLYLAIGDSETNRQRIAAVEKLFNFPPNKLCVPKRVLVGEGVLTKICRRKPKLRHFFLFNDVLLYGRVLMHRKVLRNPQFIDLTDTSVEDVRDNGIYRNGFSVLSPKKSFTVYSVSSEEKAQWVNHLNLCIKESRALVGVGTCDLVKHSPVWIPDSEATHCMVCTTSEFNLVNRRHHCRHCGKVVCHKCSTYRWILPYQSSSRVRVCRACHDQLQSEKERQAGQVKLKSPIPDQQAESPFEQNADRFVSFAAPNSFTQTSFNEPTFLGDAIANEDYDTASDTESESDVDSRNLPA
ncbi:hypothetical protein EG68_10157 [Paragonimus skrjabini miyazakii]|uniref:Pleckstrin homology domain-containing family F member 2 n=1 Tax=Paragonimus skrjabini miyazakii TaxID=59628 RepID=A0A8S9YF78_9TREM|nr:hypothetical protein EG68_10157 [Paragonimus skrjabini miyazakii]